MLGDFLNFDKMILLSLLKLFLDWNYHLYYCWFSHDYFRSKLLLGRRTAGTVRPGYINFGAAWCSRVLRAVNHHI